MAEPNDQEALDAMAVDDPELAAALAMSMQGEDAAGAPLAAAEDEEMDPELAMARVACGSRARDSSPGAATQAIALSLQQSAAPPSGAAGPAAPPPWAPAAAAAAAPPALTAFQQSAAAAFASLFAQAGAASAPAAAPAVPSRPVAPPPPFPAWWDAATAPAAPPAVPLTAASLAALAAALGAPLAASPPMAGAAAPAANAIPLPLAGGALSERALAAAVKSRLASRRLGRGESEIGAIAAAYIAAGSLEPPLGALLRFSLVRHVASTLASDAAAGEDLYFSGGGRFRTAFTEALAAQKVPPALLEEAVAHTATPAAAACWAELLAAAAGGLEGAELDDLSAVELKLSVLDRLTACPPLARCLAARLHAEAAAFAVVPADAQGLPPFGAGANFERTCLLRGLLAFSPLPGPKGAPSPGATAALRRLKGYPRSPHGDRERVASTLGHAVSRAHAAAHAVLERCAKQRGACLEAVLAWLAAAAAAGLARPPAAGVHAQRPALVAASGATSDAFACGVAAVTLRFCRPFLGGAPQQLGRIIGAAPLASRWRLDRLHIGDALRSGADAAAAREAFDTAPTAAAWRPFFAPAGGEAPHFVPECYHLAAAAVHTGLVPAWESLERHRYALDSAAGHNGEALAQDERYNLLVDSATSGLLHAELGSDALRFVLLTAAWLLRTAELPEAQARAAFSAMPAAAVRDSAALVVYALRFGRADLLSGAAGEHLPVAALVEMAATLLSNRDLAPSPLVVGALVDALHAMLCADALLRGGAGGGRTGSAAHDALVGAVLANPAARRKLPPALIVAYASLDAVEGLDVDRDAFDKFDCRHKLARLLRELWAQPECAAAVADLAAAPASDPEAAATAFEAFADAALKDLQYLLTDSLSRLVSVRDLQLRRADEATWAAQPPTVRAEQEAFLGAQENAARGFMRQARGTLILLTTLAGTPAVAAAFLASKTAGPSAYAVVHFLELLLGPKCEGLKVANPEKYGFDPRALLLGIVDFTLRLDALGPLLAVAVAAEDDYDVAVLERAGSVMAHRGVGDASHTARLRAFIGRCEAARAARSPGAMAVDAPAAPAQLDPAWESAYTTAMAPLLYSDVAGGLGGFFRQFEELAARPEAAATSRAKARRLAKEHAELSAPDGSLATQLRPGNALVVRVDGERLDKVRVLMTGPAGTPYALGAFVFDVFFPAEYPAKAPLVNFDTTGGGRVRFNPNLYADGKVCLSLLGTWHAAHASEKWDPAASSLNQVLLSIQAMILTEDPMFNEPGFEGIRGTEEGARKSRQYNEEIQLFTLRHAVLAHLRKPRAALEAPLAAHFRAAGPAIRAQAAAWVAAAADPTLKARMGEAAAEVGAELDKL